MDVLTNPNILELRRLLNFPYQLYLVGGAVRDFVLMKESKDLDFATNLSCEEMAVRLQGNGAQFYLTGLKHNTITVLVNGTPLEVTTFRDADCTIEGDLALRDFTMNAMAIHAPSGEFLDPFSGRSDLAWGVIRFIPCENPFEKDPLRILRMIRFSATLGFRIHRGCLSDAAFTAHLLLNVSPERIRDELVKILVSDRPKEAFIKMYNLGILEAILPELASGAGIVQNSYHNEDVLDHILSVVENIPNDPILRLAALFHDIAKPQCVTTDERGDRHFLRHEDVGAEMTKEIMGRLKSSNEEIEKVSKLVALHMRPVIGLTPRGRRRLIKDCGELLPEFFELKNADRKAHTNPEPLDEFLEAVEEVYKERDRKDVPNFRTLAIGGKDLLEIGFVQGPEIGKMLKHLEEMVLEDPEINQREMLLLTAVVEKEI